MQERRVHRRLSERHDVAVAILSAPGEHSLENRTLQCHSEDISEGGVRLALPSPVPPGSALELRLTVPRPRRVFWHVGTVVWVKKTGTPGSPYSVGVRFTRTPESTLRLWEKILREKISRVHTDRGPSSEDGRSGARRTAPRAPSSAGSGG